MTLTAAESGFARAAIRRERLFLALSVLGVAVAIGLIAHMVYRRLDDPGYALGIRVTLAILILLNARQNLRQYRYAAVLRKLMRDDG